MRYLYALGLFALVGTLAFPQQQPPANITPRIKGKTPDTETVVDALHPGGFQVLGGSRIPLIMFGGHVKQGIESNWHSHAGLLKTVIDLLHLPNFGIARVDTARSSATNAARRPGDGR